MTSPLATREQSATAGSKRVLVYDGDCPFCLATIALAIRTGLVPAEQTRSNHALQDADSEPCRTAGIRNQLVVLDPITRETRIGDGRIVMDHWRATPLFVARRPVEPAGDSAIAALGIRDDLLQSPRDQPAAAPNRLRLRARGDARATTDADRAAGGNRRACSGGIWRRAFAVLALGDVGRRAFMATSTLGSGFVLVAIGAFVLLRAEQRIDYVAHLAVTAIVGAVILAPAVLVTMLADYLPRGLVAAIECVALVTSFGVMFAMQRRRVAAQALPRGWLLAWAALVGVGWLTTLWIVLGGAKQ